MAIKPSYLTDPFFDGFDIALRNAYDANKGFQSIFLNTTKTPYPIDSYLTDEAFIIELPILDAVLEDVDISYTGGTLTIKYARSNRPDTTGRNYVQNSITRKDFALDWNLGPKFDLTGIESKYSNGLLTVTIPKSKKVPIQIEKVQVEVKH